MQQIFFLRSYGDFVVALFVLQEVKQPNNHYIASLHLQPLYNALQHVLDKQLPPFEFIDLGIQYGLLSVFTNRYFFSTNTVQELKALRKYIKQAKPKAANSYWLEQGTRKQYIEIATGETMNSIHDNPNHNIYDSYTNFCRSNVKNNLIINNRSINNVAVFPDSRLKRKCLSAQTIDIVGNTLSATGKKITVHYFGKTYTNFESLIEQVVTTDFVISSDSLPAHIAQFFNKPHAIVYQHNINREWETPLARYNNMVATTNDLEPLMNRIAAL